MRKHSGSRYHVGSCIHFSSKNGGKIHISLSYTQKYKVEWEKNFICIFGLHLTEHIFSYSFTQGKLFFTNTKLISLYESVCFTFSCWQIDRKCIGFQPERKDSCHGGKIWGLRKDSRIYRSGKNQLRASDYPEDGRNSPSW